MKTRILGLDSSGFSAISLSCTEVLLELAEDLVLDPVAAEEMIRKRSFSDTGYVDWKSAHEIGGTGVPIFVTGNRGLVGGSHMKLWNS